MRDNRRLASVLTLVWVVLAIILGFVVLTILLPDCRSAAPTAPAAAKAGAVASGRSYVRVWLLEAWEPTTDYVRLTIGRDAVNQIGIVGHRLDGSEQFHRWNTVGAIWGYHDVPGPGEYLGEMYLHFVYVNGVEDVNYTWSLRTQQSIVGFYSNGLGAHHSMNSIVEITAFPEDAPEKETARRFTPRTVAP